MAADFGLVRRPWLYLGVLPVHSVEELCDQLRSAARAGGDVSLWVPDELTLKGTRVPEQPTGIAMSIITDTALSLGLWPNGFTEGTDGRTYYYQGT